jgi:hypothetical protein
MCQLPSSRPWTLAIHLSWPKLNILLTASFPLASFQYNSFDTYSIHVVIYPCHVVNSVRMPLQFVRFSAATAAFFLTDDFGVSWQSTQLFLS